MSRPSATEATVTTARGNASAARKLGHTIYAPELPLPGGALTVDLAINRWGIVIEAIEDEGWALAAWSAADGKGYPVFRLAVAP